MHNQTKTLFVPSKRTLGKGVGIVLARPDHEEQGDHKLDGDPGAQVSPSKQLTR